MGGLFSKLECGSRERKDNGAYGSGTSNERISSSARCEIRGLKDQIAAIHAQLMQEQVAFKRFKQMKEKEVPATPSSDQRMLEAQVAALSVENVALRNSKDSISTQVDVLRDQLRSSLEQRNELVSTVERLQCELADVESFLKSERGNNMKQMENDLAQTKLELALAQEEKDEMEWEIQNLLYQLGKSPKPGPRPPSSLKKSGMKKTKREALMQVNLNSRAFQTPIRDALTPH